MKRLFKVLVLAGTVLWAGCSSGITTPSGPADVRVDIQYAFDGERVELELDGERIYSERVTTDHIWSVAELVQFSVAEGRHEIKATVGGASATLGFDASTTRVVAVRYDRAARRVELEALAEPPLYD